MKDREKQREAEEKGNHRERKGRAMEERPQEANLWF